MVDQRNQRCQSKNGHCRYAFRIAASFWSNPVGTGTNAVILKVLITSRPFAELLTQFYGPYGYSISGAGIVIGALLGFCEGFVHLGIFGLIYRWLPIAR